MSRRGNSHENAVAESFFSSLKHERIRRGTYKTRDEARQDVFDYIEMFYNPLRKQEATRLQPSGRNVSRMGASISFFRPSSWFFFQSILKRRMIRRTKP